MPKTVHFDVQYAGFLRRLLAILLDLLLIGLLTSVVLAMTFGTDYVRNMDQAASLASIDWRATAVDQALSAIWFIGFWVWWMATPGKQLFDCCIVDADTLQAPRLSRLLLRYLGYLVSSLPLGLGFVWILFDSRGQGWHDKMANTVVILQDESLSDQGLVI